MSDVLEVDGRPALLMACVDGPDLGTFLRTASPALPDVEAGVAHAHAAGVFHRDLEPGNVLLELVSGRPVPRVSDFGIARRSADHTDQHGITGTLPYLAPEQLADRPQALRSAGSSSGWRRCTPNVRVRRAGDIHPRSDAKPPRSGSISARRCTDERIERTVMQLARHIPMVAYLFLAVTGCERTEVEPGEIWDRPVNEWQVAEPPAGLVGEGFEVGQTVPDVRLVDQNGDTVSLWQFWGDVVLVTVSAVWCRPCHDLAVTAEDVREDFSPGDVTLLTILEEDGGGLAPELEDAVAWSDAFGVASPVMVDPEHELSSALQGSYPAVLLLDRELVVVEHARDLSSENLHDLIESEL